jgi:hypothetical protein
MNSFVVGFGFGVLVEYLTVLLGRVLVRLLRPVS